MRRTKRHHIKMLCQVLLIIKRQMSDRMDIKSRNNVFISALYEYAYIRDRRRMHSGSLDDWRQRRRHLTSVNRRRRVWLWAKQTLQPLNLWPTSHIRHDTFLNAKCYLTSQTQLYPPGALDDTNHSYNCQQNMSLCPTVYYLLVPAQVRVNQSPELLVLQNSAQIQACSSRRHWCRWVGKWTSRGGK